MILRSEHDGRCIGLGCDVCGEIFDAGDREWGEMWGDAKEEGWDGRRVGPGANDWEHSCPDCQV